MVQRSSVGCSSSFYCIWAHLFYSILLCCLGRLLNRRQCCLWTCIFKVVCSIPGGVCLKAACVLPFDLSLIQQVVMPLDMSVPHWTVLHLKSKRSSPTAALRCLWTCLSYSSLHCLWMCIFYSSLCCLCMCAFCSSMCCLCKPLFTSVADPDVYLESRFLPILDPGS
jgi:hypothetical protein